MDLSKLLTLEIRASFLQKSGYTLRPVGSRMQQEIEVGFKETYTEFLEKKGFDIIYIGDGNSDIFSARRAKYVFAVDELLKRCRKEKLPCASFTDFFDIIKGLEAITLG